MKFNLFLLAIIGSVLLFPACKKSNNNTVPDYTSQINGAWIWSGSGYYNNTPLDIFTPYTITTVNDTSIVTGSGDTLIYQSANASPQTSVFQLSPTQQLFYSSQGAFISETLTYNYATHSITDASSFGCGLCTAEGMTMTTPAYPVNTALKTQSSAIAASVILSGTVYDTLLYRPDSMYNLTATLYLTPLNDSTIQYKPDILGVGDSILHYRSIDANAQTITYQTFHSLAQRNTYTAVTYNYVAHTYVFEQYVLLLPGNIYMKLQ